MKTGNLILFSIISFTLSISSSFALIKIDDDSINLAIKYGIKSKDYSNMDLLGSNWINDNTGRILNIYSPFIQIAVKAAAQNTTGNPEEDLKIVKKRIENNILKVKTRNEVRFIVNIYGDSEDFAQKYRAYIVEDYYESESRQKIIKPKKSSMQKIAEKDSYILNHPYSAVNCYTFKFNDLFKLQQYYFILVPIEGEKIKYRINNQEIY